MGFGDFELCAEFAFPGLGCFQRLALNVDFPPSINVGFGRRGGNPGMEEAFSGRALQRRQRDEKVKRLRELFAQAMLAAKKRLDPKGMLNPGVLFDPD